MSIPTPTDGGRAVPTEDEEDTLPARQVDHERARRGEPHAVGHPLEEPRAELGLAPGQGPRQGGLRGPERVRGRGDVLVVGDGDEPAEVADLHDSTVARRHASRV